LVFQDTMDRQDYRGFEVRRVPQDQKVTMVSMVELECKGSKEIGVVLAIQVYQEHREDTDDQESRDRAVHPEYRAVTERKAIAVATENEARTAYLDHWDVRVWTDLEENLETVVTRSKV